MFVGGDAVRFALRSPAAMKKRFAWTPHEPGIISLITEWAAAKQPLEIHAMLDGSMFEPYVIKELVGHDVMLDSAFAGTSLAGYEELGPMRCRLPPAHQNIIQRLSTKARGIPALSFIAARCDTNSLCECLAWLARVQTEDGQEQLCRYTDTRVLASHIDSLTAEQKAALASCIGAWAWIARDGTLQEVTFEMPASIGELPRAPLILSAAQFDSVLTAAEPDILFQMLVEHSPELIPDGEAHLFHARLKKLIETAKVRGLSDLPDFFTYITIALMTDDHFDQHPAVQETWQRLKDGEGRFGEQVERWPESVIESLRNKSVH